MKRCMIIVAIFLILRIGTLSASLIAHYEFNGNALDSSGNGYNGTANNVSLAADRFGNANSAYYFNGSASVNTNHDFSWNNAQSYTISLWFKTDDINLQQTLIGKGYSSGYEYSMKLARTWGGSDLLYEHWTGGGNGAINLSVPQYQLSSNVWYNAIVSYNSITKEAAMYLDGIKVSSHSVSATLNDVANNTVIGSAYFWQGQGRTFTGYMDDVRIYNHALSISEVHNVAGIPEPTGYMLYGLALVLFLVLRRPVVGL